MKGLMLIIGLILIIVFLFVGFRIYKQNKEISKIEKAVVTDSVIEIEERSGETVTLIKTPTGITSEGTLEINPNESYLKFTGFGPGKSHEGEFESMTADIVFDEGSVVGGKLTIETSSVKTDSEGLDSHLVTGDFFDTENYPQIIFNLNEVIVNDMDQSAMGNGTLGMRGITKDISAPLTILANGFYTKFTIDSSLFGISYTGVNNEVQIESQIIWN